MPAIAAADATISILRRLGVEAIFGIPGGQTIALLDAMLRDGAIRFVTTRHEGVAACAADAYGRLTGRPGVALATTGPGATNLLTGVGGAFRDSSPAIYIVCDNRSEHLGRDDTQAADHAAIFGPLTKSTFTVTAPDELAHCFQEGYRRAIEDSPGPVLINIARDVLEDGCVAAEDIDAVEPWIRQRRSPSRESVRRAARLILSSERPLIWAGRGATISGAHEVLLSLAEEVEAPVVTTFNGIGSVPTTHSNVLGPLSRSGTALASSALAEADLVILIGNSLNGVSTGHWSIKLPQLIQVDVNEAVIGATYSVAAGLVGDAKATCAMLIDEIRASRAGGHNLARANWLEELQRRADRWRVDAFSEEGYEGDGIPAPTVIRSLRAAAPDDTIFCVDAGNPGIWTHLLEIRQPRTYFKPVGFGNMGFSLGAAIAASIAEPTKPVAAVIGDGSLGMTLGDLETLARERVNATVLVMNNSAYGNIKQEQLYKLGAARYLGVDLSPTDYAAVGRTLGVDGRHVRTVEELDRALAIGISSDEPFIIDAAISERNVWFKPF